jgi:hypothetical protein
MQHEVVAQSHDLVLGGTRASIMGLHEELQMVVREAGHDPSGLLGDLLFSMEINSQ